MPGRIVKVAVRDGDAVEEHALLIVLEAMKMEHRIEASAAATVKAVLVKEGQIVAGGTPLVELGSCSSMRLPQQVTIFEMGARDGLQNERALISTDDKVRYIDLLSETGLRWIEATSFVSPKAIPQLADAADVFSRIRKAPGARYPVLVPNLKGYERARAAGADAIAVFTAASERFTKRNINMTIDESLATFSDVVRAAKRDGCWVRGYVSTAFGSPFGDEVTPQMVLDVSVKLMEMGCDELSDRRHDRRRRPEPSRCDRAAAGVKDSARIDRPALSRYARHGNRQHLRGTRVRRCEIRCVVGRFGRLPVRARRNRQRRHRRRALSSARNGY